MRDQDFMRLALREAKKGQWRTAPNPAVGAVVVRGGEVVGRGWHRRTGTPHAEVHALAAAGERARGATVYVTLEPCNHTGRTPPCTRALLAAGVKKVVIGMADPNPRVAGGGAGFLAANGVEVVTGVLEDECRAINRPFIKHALTGTPWTVMKAAVSLDGRIAARTGHSRWVTGEDARAYGHRLRDRLDAILVGRGTVAADDPSLTARPPRGRGRDPLRVVLDSGLALDPSARVFSPDGPGAVVFCSARAPVARQRLFTGRGVRVEQVEEKGGVLDPGAVLKKLGSMGVQSLLVEGGGQVHASFLAAGLYDEIHIFYAPVIIGADGLPMCGGLGVEKMDDAVRLPPGRLRRVGDDFLYHAVLTTV